MKDQPSRRRTPTLLLTTIALGACTSGSSTGPSGSSGTQTLAPGEAPQVWVGPTYRAINVCNDTTSKGTVTVTIDARGSDVLAPGLCTQNTGSSINLVNEGGGPALIVYRSESRPISLYD
jgi:hypothetical protein